MKVFNEEPVAGKKTQKFILILDRKEAVELLDLAATALKANPKKTG